MKVFAIVMPPVFALVISSIAFRVAGKPSAPMGLLVDGVSNPLAIDCGMARFTWMSEDTARGERQTAYQILVSGNRANLAAGTGDWWNNGKVASDKSASVEYAGRALPPATRFWWEVRMGWKSVWKGANGDKSPLLPEKKRARTGKRRRKSVEQE